jgi:hypothetical protein
MTTPFDGLKPFSFSGTEFPYKTYRVQGGIRKHEFTFPHSPGGITELLGRKLYEVHVSASFTQGLTKKYPNLWGNLASLRKHFEYQDSGVINIPHIGPMLGFANSWDETVNSHNRSTIDVEMTFTEDQNDEFATAWRLNFDSAGTMASKLDTFNAEVLRNQLLLSDNTQNIFSIVNSVCSSILSIKDQIDLYGSLVVSKIDSAVAIIREADQQVKELNNPDFWPLLDSLQELWFSTVQLQQDILENDIVLRTFTVPIRMSVAQASAAIFGDSSKAVDIMTLNALDDPLSIPAGIQLKYYTNILTK